MLPYATKPVAVHSDTSYLSEPDSKSHVGGHYFLTAHNSSAQNNGTILTLAAIIWHVVSLAELAALFYNCKNEGPLHQTLKEMGHPMALSLTQIPNASKAMEMWLNWLKWCQAQQQFDF